MASVDDLKAERDGHLFWGVHRPRPERKPPMWIVERGEDGMPVRMWWTGYDDKGKRVWPLEETPQQEGAQK